MNYYHPDTLEHIRNPLPAVAEWAGATALVVPAYDPQTQQCMFVDGVWKVEDVVIVPPPTPRIAELKSELAALDQRRIRPMAEGDTDYLATLNAQAVTLREELKGLVK